MASTNSPDEWDTKISTLLEYMYVCKCVYV
jgi:hypothetical protein